MKKLFYSFLISMSASLLALDSKDNLEIQHIVDHFTHVWNDCDGHGSADFYSQEADFVNIFGMAFSGKEEIESRHVAIHETFLKNSIFEVLHLKIREAKPDVAIVHVNWKVSIPGKDQTEMQGFSRMCF